MFKTFISDFKALISSLDKLHDGLVLKDKILDSKFLLSMLFLSDVNCFMATASKTVETSSNLPWDYSKRVNHLIVQTNSMLDQLTCIIKNENNDRNLGETIHLLNLDIFPSFKNAAEILDYSASQVIQRSTKGGNDSTSPTCVEN